MTTAMMTPSEHPRLLTPSELSDRYRQKLSIRTLANWRCDGRGPKFKRLNGRIFYDVKDVEEWEQKNTYASTSGYKA